MKLNEAFKHLVKRLGWKSEEEKSMQVPEHLRKLVHMIEITQDIELSCDEVYKLLDQYTEAVAYGYDLKELKPLVDQHIEICPDCREEFEALLRILQSSRI